MAETPSGMLNSIGLQGPGIDAFVENDLAWLRHRGARAVVSIAGGTVDEYAKLAQRLRNSDGVSAVEVNISCPNVESRGQVFACDPVAAAEVVAAVRRATTPGVPVIAKLSPDVTDIVAVARACVDRRRRRALADQHDARHGHRPDTLRPALAGVTGGLSGPAIRPMAVRCVYQVHAALPARADLRHGRHPHRRRRPGVRPRRGERGLGGHRAVPRPLGADPDRARAARSRWPTAASTGSPTRSGTPTGPRPGEVAGDEATAPHPEQPDDEDSDDFGPDVDALAR